MSRTGPAYIESESELYADLERKRENGEITDETVETFVDLFEFAREIGDRVKIGGAKNANFQLKDDAHLGDYQNDPSVFTANVKGKLKIWPAKMVFDHDPTGNSIAWDREDYDDYAKSFQSLTGVTHGSESVRFDTFSQGNNLPRFESIVEDFVNTCRQKALDSTD